MIVELQLSPKFEVVTTCVVITGTYGGPLAHWIESLSQRRKGLQVGQDATIEKLLETPNTGMNAYCDYVSIGA